MIRAVQRWALAHLAGVVPLEDHRKTDRAWMDEAEKRRQAEDGVRTERAIAELYRQREEATHKRFEREGRRAQHWQREAKHYHRRLQAALDRLDALAGTGARQQESAAKRAEREKWDDALATIASAVADSIPEGQPDVRARALAAAEARLRQQGADRAEDVAEWVRLGIGDTVTVPRDDEAYDDD